MNNQPNQGERIGRRLGYVRVSDQDQTELLQVDALAAIGCDLVYHDHGCSGALQHRPALDRLLADLTAGDTLLVWKLDRLGRSTVHLLQLLSELRARGVDFVAITQGIDTTTAIGRMLYGQLAVFAEFEREQISDRTKAGMAAARQRGIHLGRPPTLDRDQVEQATRALAAGTATVQSVANSYHVSRQTLLRALRRCA